MSEASLRDDKTAFAADPATTGKMKVSKPMNGEQFLDSLRDGREIYIYGERVKDVTTHPAFRNTARMVARLYDALHDPKHQDKLLQPTDTGNGGMTQAYFKAPKTVAESVAGRDAIAEWAKITYGWLGRAPDYKAAFLGTLGANADFYDPWQENAKRWYQFCQERVPFVNHAIIHPPVDRNRPPNEVGDVCCHVEKETDAGIVVSGAKVVATGSALTNYTFVAHHGLIPVQDKNFAAIFMIPTNAPGVKLICRTSYEMTSTAMGSPFDYPLSSRIDENDAVFILDKVLIPWENVFCYGDIEKANNFFPRTGFLPRALLHGCTRLAVKLDFIAGLLLKAVEATGSKDFRGVQANVGEVLVWRNLFWGLTEAMARNPKPWVGDYLLPDIEPAGAYQIVSTMAYTKVKYIIEQTVASGLIYLNSSARDFKNPEIRPYIDKYMRGSNGYDAVDRVKLLKLLWDAIGSEFGSRHELYEINYGGSTEEIRRYVLFGAMAGGTAKNLQGFAEQCMAEYDLDGWKVPDLVDPDELSYHVIRSASSVSPQIAREQESAPRQHSMSNPGTDFSSSNQSGGFRNPYAVP
ncbi:4-hydroxyphenylacetate 3-hydroxylase N-terminal domain-containing protein [Pseudorhodoplanes sp.]|uniref:4-hydroxyphenylacetate 3-hydroxylase N-terminal domain-containing protein n=1 Tax=Pseudorhodoplanes sp. TaxID=1934341 RepID=UPI002C1F89CA|nr:4-hydroxyphenylacetate 3-hydroxylase N-terminal domain-containing protein [Pseudorhodoplanes sp.]HWV44305.1 4-hydroxyphenylacetate 3-hydroxylase N-terminal domain-containing protein [Pseudorhodoplanes sp.]